MKDILYIYLIITGFFALILGVLVGILFQSKKAKKKKILLKKNNTILQEQNIALTETNKNLDKQIVALQLEIKDNVAEKESLIKVNATQTADLKNLEEKLNNNKEEVAKLQEKLTKDFELLANKILEEKSVKFTQQNKQNITDILNPLQDKIQKFEQKVEATQKENIGMHSALREQLSGLKELNQKISKEALNLTKALKGESKTQGNWGELVLERVLEKSGLEKDREYFVQQSFTTEEGKRLMPDVVIHLPDNKKIIIDSKVSLTAYEKYVNTENETDKELYLKEHTLSIKRHVEQLSEKRYEDIYKIESPDFVLLFIPIEPAFSAALKRESHLYNNAFDKNIVIVTPSTLLATLKTVDTMWNNEKQKKNAVDIAEQAGALYDKFEGLLSDLIGIGKKIDASKSDYNAAMNKLVEGRGNLITRVERLKKMGAKAKKALPEKIINRANEESH